MSGNRTDVEVIPRRAIIRDEGVAIAEVPFFNFIGAGVTATLDAANKEVEINVPGGGGAHAVDHQNGGADEVSVAGLSGELADNQPPKIHTASHQSGGGDAVKLDDLAAPDDNTDRDVSITVHGLAPKLPNDATKYLNGIGGWTVPAGGGGGDAGEGHIVLLGNNYDTIGAGTWAEIGSSTAFVGYFYNTSDNDGDNITWKVYLAAGTYDLIGLLYKRADSPIVDIDIDGGEVASWDLYNAATLANQNFRENAINVAASGLKTITFRVDGKNGSSSDHLVRLQSLALMRKS